jgi:outer membrane protein assembly factor BamB
VSSDGGERPVVWVLDANVPRTASLLDPATPPPVLYAVDGTTLELLWKSAPADLTVGGKYATVVVADGRVFAATDRVHAFGLH